MRRLKRIAAFLRFLPEALVLLWSKKGEGAPQKKEPKVKEPLLQIYPCIEPALPKHRRRRHKQAQRGGSGDE